ncbi:hypothetical protein E2C01_063101 [Portunus trituberculatus]|uniref:Uncharacterized protein n=1 Tax=Portunus trituberculatus TaxID=210409 RepID=A0A5B7H8B0_PORTR|nr:hypothetical protein [Portunus trituberculatus]
MHHSLPYPSSLLVQNNNSISSSSSSLAQHATKTPCQASPAMSPLQCLPLLNMPPKRPAKPALQCRLALLRRPVSLIEVKLDIIHRHE